jgi:hypothetical protein
LHEIARQPFPGPRSASKLAWHQVEMSWWLFSSLMMQPPKPLLSLFLGA